MKTYTKNSWNYGGWKMLTNHVNSEFTITNVFFNKNRSSHLGKFIDNGQWCSRSWIQGNRYVFDPSSHLQKIQKCFSTFRHIRINLKMIQMLPKLKINLLPKTSVLGTPNWIIHDSWSVAVGDTAGTMIIWNTYQDFQTMFVVSLHVSCLVIGYESACN